MARRYIAAPEARAGARRDFAPALVEDSLQPLNYPTKIVPACGFPPFLPTVAVKHAEPLQDTLCPTSPHGGRPRDRWPVRQCGKLFQHFSCVEVVDCGGRSAIRNRGAYRDLLAPPCGRLHCGGHFVFPNRTDSASPSYPAATGVDGRRLMSSRALRKSATRRMTCWSSSTM
jgi:hypothetical protein